MSLTDNTEQDNKLLDDVLGGGCLTGDESAYVFWGYEDASDLIMDLVEGTWDGYYNTKLWLHNS